MYAAIRIRGEVNIRKPIKDTLAGLRLHKVNHLVLLPLEKSAENMLKAGRDYLTYGEIDKKTLEKLLEKRAKLPGNKRLTKEWLKKSKIASFSELAKMLLEGKKSLKKLGIKPVFRMKPPSKGYERGGIKKNFKIGGALGYRGEKINALINRML